MICENCRVNFQRNLSIKFEKTHGYIIGKGSTKYDVRSISVDKRY